MRNLHESNLGYPVLIILSTGSSGSGFILSINSSNFLITAKHVLFDLDNGNLLAPTANLLIQTKKVEDDSTFLFSLSFLEMDSDNILSHPDKDIAAIKISRIYNDKIGTGYSSKVEKGIKIERQGKSELVSVPEDGFALMSEVLISNDVFLLGYPSSLGLIESPQFDYYKPLLRKGIVASLDKRRGTIILDCPVYYGNSGGPVIQVDLNYPRVDLKVIGVVSEFIPYQENWINQSNSIIHNEISNSGYSVAVPMDYIIEMINGKDN